MVDVGFPLHRLGEQERGHERSPNTFNGLQAVGVSDH